MKIDEQQPTLKNNKCGSASLKVRWEFKSNAYFKRLAGPPHLSFLKPLAIIIKTHGALTHRKDKFKVYKSPEDFISSSNIPLLTMEELGLLIDDEKIKDEKDRQLAEIIIDAENDWIITIHNLNDFLVVLEREIDGETSKENLEKLLTHYNSRIEKYAWEAESVNTLLQAFDFSNERTLRMIFFNLSNRIRKNINDCQQ